MTGATMSARAPVRVSFAGGGTDVPPFSHLEGGAVLSAAIDRHVHVQLAGRPDDRQELRSVHGPEGASAVPLRASDGVIADIVRCAASRFGVEGRGFEVAVSSEVPPGSGLGGSSALAVAVVACMARWCGLRLTRERVAQEAIAIERNDLGLPGGFQDHYAAAFGGINLIEFEGSTGIVHPLELTQKARASLRAWVMVVDSGQTRESHPIVLDQAKRVTAQMPASIAALRNQKDLVYKMRDSLIGADMPALARLLRRSWELKQLLSPYISNETIDAALIAAHRAGAQGAKVTGAGGGGHILLLCPPRRQRSVASVFREYGMNVGRSVTVGSPGTTTSASHLSSFSLLP